MKKTIKYIPVLIITVFFMVSFAWSMEGKKVSEHKSNQIHSVRLGGVNDPRSGDQMGVSGGERLSSPELIQQMKAEFQRHNYKKVMKLYKDYVAAHEKDFIPLSTRVFYSQALADTGDLDGSIKVLQGVLSDWPLSMDLFRIEYDLANLLFMEGKKEEARSLYQKILVQNSKSQEIVSKVRGRLAQMKQVESKKKDFLSLQLLDIETSLEAGEVPEGAVDLLKQIQEKNVGSLQAERAKNLLAKIVDVRTEKARALLDEARRLFDEEKKYDEVRDLLAQLQKEYSDVVEIKSIEALRKEVKTKSGK